MAKRRVFISTCYKDRLKAKGFNLLRWNKNVDVEFVGRHLLDPVDSTNERYIAQCIKEQICNTSVTVVLIGRDTSCSDWVNKEIEWSLAKERPNGILGIKLEPGVVVPVALHDCGAEIVEWDVHEFGDAIERAAIAAGRPCVATESASCAR